MMCCLVRENIVLGQLNIEVKVGIIGQGNTRRRLIDAPPELPGEIKFENDGQGIFGSPGAADLIRKQGIDLSKADYFGPMLALSAKILTGERPTDADYKNASLGVNFY